MPRSLTSKQASERASDGEEQLHRAEASLAMILNFLPEPHSRSIRLFLWLEADAAAKSVYSSTRTGPGPPEFAVCMSRLAVCL